MGRLERHLDDDAIARVRAGIKREEPTLTRRDTVARESGTYRAARRNAALRCEFPTVWGFRNYYESHHV